jgi:hypothetical protein
LLTPVLQTSQEHVAQAQFGIALVFGHWNKQLTMNSSMALTVLLERLIAAVGVGFVVAASRSNCDGLHNRLKPE